MCWSTLPVPTGQLRHTRAAVFVDRTVKGYETFFDHNLIPMLFYSDIRRTSLRHYGGCHEWQIYSELNVYKGSLPLMADVAVEPTPTLLLNSTIFASS